MSTEKTNKKTAEEGKNINRKKNSAKEKEISANTKKQKTKDRADVNADVDQE